MPVYEYRCRCCEERFERLGAISAREARVDCPACGAERSERLVSTFAAIAAESGQSLPLAGGCCGGGAGGCACRG